MPARKPEPRATSLNAFVFARAVLAFTLLLFAVGSAGYVLIMRPALERHAQWIAADLFPRAGTCDVDALRMRVASVSRALTDAGLTLDDGFGAAPARDRRVFGVLPFDAMLAEGIQARIGVPVRVRSTMRDVALGFSCGGSWATLRVQRSRTLGAVPDLALLSWLVALIGGSLALAAGLSRSLSRPLRKLSVHLRGTPLGASLRAAPNTGIVEINGLAMEVDALRARAGNAVANRSALLMGLSHDLRAPLARLRLALDTIATPTASDLTEMRDDTLELQEALDEFMRAANAMASPVAVDGASQAWRRLQRGYAHPRLSFHGAPDGASPALNTAALVRVAANLIDNALRHTSGPVDVFWSSGAGWRLCVRDAGPGIPSERIESTQQAFRSSAAERGMHAGLGIALATILCEHNGWRLAHGRISDAYWTICIEGT